jgi:hypothetical protein
LIDKEWKIVIGFKQNRDFTNFESKLRGLRAARKERPNFFCWEDNRSTVTQDKNDLDLVG